MPEVEEQEEQAIEMVRDAQGRFVPGVAQVNPRKQPDKSWHEAFLSLLRTKPDPAVACLELGIPYRTFTDHRARYHDFAEALEEAFEMGRAFFLRILIEKAASGHDMRALLETLKILYPEHYRQAAQVNINTKIDITLIKRLDFTKLPQNIIDMFEGRLVNEELLQELLSKPEYLLPEGGMKEK